MDDGMLCRDKNDCTWLDENLECDHYSIDWDKNSGKDVHYFMIKIFNVQVDINRRGENRDFYGGA